MLNSLSSIDHCTSHPAVLGLFMAFHSGWFVRTTMVWAWKYGRSFLIAVMSAKASFSMGEYLSSTPTNARLV